MPKDNKSDGIILLELLAERNISARSFKNIYCEKAGCAENTAAALLNRNKSAINPPELSLICSLFGFSPADFGYSRDFFESEYSASGSREVFSYNFRDEGNDAYRPYMENFFRTLNKHLLRTKNSLRISDYTAKFKGIQQKEQVDYYMRESKAYFKKIEERLSDKDFRYARIFQLPLHSRIDDRHSAKQFLVETLMPDTYEHICRCLYHYDIQCAFFIVPRPYRTYSYCIADDHTIITEYNRFDKEGTPVPDLLFINQVKNVSSEDTGNVYIKSSTDEFDRMAQQNSQYRLNAYSLFTGVTELKNKREESKRSLLQESELIKIQLPKTPYGSTDYYEQTKQLEDNLLKVKALEDQIAGLDEKVKIWSAIAVS